MKPKVFVVLNSVGVLALVIASCYEIARELGQDVEQLRLHHGVGVYAFVKLIESVYGLKQVFMESTSD